MRWTCKLCGSANRGATCPICASTRPVRTFGSYVWEFIWKFFGTVAALIALFAGLFFIAIYLTDHGIKIESIGSNAFAIILLLLLPVVYFLPVLTAWRRKHRNAAGVFLVNLFFGWTLLGWVVAMIWAIYRPPEALR